MENWKFGESPDPYDLRFRSAKYALVLVMGGDCDLGVHLDGDFAEMTRAAGPDVAALVLVDYPEPEEDEERPKTARVLEVLPSVTPGDDSDPLPGGGDAVFQSAMVQAIERLHNDLQSFVDDDDLGIYIETSLRPTPSDPGHRSDDNSSGIHNYIHNRWADPASEIDLGDPRVNQENQRFWKLHVWLDNRWQAFRSETGLDDTQPSYVEAMEQAEAHLPSAPSPDPVVTPGMFPSPMSHGHHHHHPLDAPEWLIDELKTVLYTCNVSDT